MISNDHSIEAFFTNRTLTKRITADDFQELKRMNRDARVMQTLSGIQTEELTRQYFNECLNHWDRYGYGLWIFFSNEGRQFIGRAGLRNIEIQNNLEIELGYALRSEFWGKGYATEIAEKIVSIGFSRLGFTAIGSFSLPSNIGSKRVMEKVGFMFEKNIIHADLPHIFTG